MKKLVLIFALLCCSTQAMATDPCTGLNGNTLKIVANGYKGVIGPAGITLSGAGYFSTFVEFLGEQEDSVGGSCSNGHITFTRIHQGQPGFTQVYDGAFSPSNSKQITGNFSQDSPVKEFVWCATVVNYVQIDSCKSQCVKDYADPLQKPPCGLECKQCRAKCDETACSW